MTELKYQKACILSEYFSIIAKALHLKFIRWSVCMRRTAIYIQESHAALCMHDHYKTGKFLIPYLFLKYILTKNN